MGNLPLFSNDLARSNNSSEISRSAGGTYDNLNSDERRGTRRLSRNMAQSEFTMERTIRALHVSNFWIGTISGRPLHTTQRNKIQFSRTRIDSISVTIQQKSPLPTWIYQMQRGGKLNDTILMRGSLRTQNICASSTSERSGLKSITHSAKGQSVCDWSFQAYPAKGYDFTCRSYLNFRCVAY
jgi:hypothetical protein